MCYEGDPPGVWTGDAPSGVGDLLGRVRSVGIGNEISPSAGLRIATAKVLGWRHGSATACRDLGFFHYMPWWPSLRQRRQWAALGQTTSVRKQLKKRPIRSVGTGRWTGGGGGRLDERRPCRRRETSCQSASRGCSRSWRARLASAMKPPTGPPVAWERPRSAPPPKGALPLERATHKGAIGRLYRLLPFDANYIGEGEKLERRPGHADDLPSEEDGEKQPVRQLLGS
jgi:hypothetical protein